MVRAASFPAYFEKALQPPFTILEYHPESSASLTFPTPFDIKLNNA